jgi:hypothetical protein
MTASIRVRRGSRRSSAVRSVDFVFRALFGDEPPVKVG